MIVMKIDCFYTYVLHTCDSMGSIKLAISFSITAKLEQELSLGIERLYVSSISVHHIDIIIGVQRYSFWPIELPILISTSTKLGLELALLIEYLDAIVISIRNDDIAALVDCYSRWVVELAILRSLGTKSKQELAGFVQYLDAMVSTIGYNDEVMLAGPRNEEGGLVFSLLCTGCSKHSQLCGYLVQIAGINSGYFHLWNSVRR